MSAVPRKTIISILFDNCSGRIRRRFTVVANCFCVFCWFVCFWSKKSSIVIGFNYCSMYLFRFSKVSQKNPFVLFHQFQKLPRTMPSILANAIVASFSSLTCPYLPTNKDSIVFYLSRTTRVSFVWRFVAFAVVIASVIVMLPLSRFRCPKLHSHNVAI